MTDDLRDETLQKLIDGLPREVEPERDLWPGIATRITPRRRLHYWPAVAAIALVAIGAIVASLLLIHPAANRTVAVAPVSSQPSSVTMPQTARAQTLAASVRHSTRLDPDTRAVLLRNLAIIENSLDNIQRALNENPNNVGLQPLLYQMYRNEAALLAAAQRSELQSTMRATKS